MVRNLNEHDDMTGCLGIILQEMVAVNGKNFSRLNTLGFFNVTIGRENGHFERSLTTASRMDLVANLLFTALPARFDNQDEDGSVKGSISVFFDMVVGFDIIGLSSTVAHVDRDKRILPRTKFLKISGYYFYR